MTKVSLYTKSKCHLCDDMKAIVYKLLDELKYEFEFEEIDITSHSELYKEYKDKIPVLLINGRIFAKYRTDEEKLKRKLNELNVT